MGMYNSVICCLISRRNQKCCFSSFSDLCVCVSVCACVRAHLGDLTNMRSYLRDVSWLHLTDACDSAWSQLSPG